MGRNYIAERTWATPAARAAQKALKAQQVRQKARREAAADAAVMKRLAVCWVKGCDKPVTFGWPSCCSEQCHTSMLAELERRDEVKQAKKLGIRVAEYRKQTQK